MTTARDRLAKHVALLHLLKLQIDKGKSFLQRSR